MLTPMLAAMALTPSTIYSFTLPDIDGKPVALSTYKGKVLLVVNVASKCGLTPQYEALEKLYLAHKGQGFVVLVFPANDFGEQEPGTNEEIKEFCTSKFSVSFPMFAKISVKGDSQHPLYQWLIAEGPTKTDIEWNFTKFLIGRDGMVADRFSPRTAPDDDAILAAVRRELAKD